MTTPLIIPDRILRFLNSLPVTAEPLEWIPAFRDELCLLLGDVDRVMVNINIGCDWQNPQNYKPGIFITHYNSRMKEDGTVLVASDKEDTSRSDNLMEYLRSEGFPLELYHPPHVFNYHVGERAYLGTIFLWRECSHEPVSPLTLELMAHLQPFFIFALTDLVARRQHSEPTDKTFIDALEGLFGTTGLSKQEQRVIVLQLFGHSYKEIADILNITMDGVKHHLKMVHKKTGARSYTELFAKYFMPRFDLRDNEDDGLPEDLKAPGLSEDKAADTVIERKVSDQSVDTYFVAGSALGERLRKFGDVAYGSVEEFARALKVAPSNLQKYFSGERNPGLGILQRLYEIGCNVNGLIGPEGSMFASNSSGRSLELKYGIPVQMNSPEGE